jgi:hypothetical protein
MCCTTCVDNFSLKFDYVSLSYAKYSIFHVNCLGAILPKHGVFFLYVCFFNFHATNYMDYIKKRRKYMPSGTVGIRASPWSLHGMLGIYYFRPISSTLSLNKAKFIRNCLGSPDELTVSQLNIIADQYLVHYHWTRQSLVLPLTHITLR